MWYAAQVALVGTASFPSLTTLLAGVAQEENVGYTEYLEGLELELTPAAVRLPLIHWVFPLFK